MNSPLEILRFVLLLIGVPILFIAILKLVFPAMTIFGALIEDKNNQRDKETTILILVAMVSLVALFGLRLIPSTFGITFKFQTPLTYTALILFVYSTIKLLTVKRKLLSKIIQAAKDDNGKGK